MNGEHLLQTIDLFIGLLIVAIAVAIIARPLRLPDTVALVVAGLGIGAVADPLGFAKELEVPPELVLLVLLPGLVFEAAYRLRIPDLRRWFGALVLLAIPGVLISAFVVAVILSVGTGLSLSLAFVVGAMVSATDPAAVVATFKRLPVSRSLATMVDGESLLNDGTGLVLFAIAIRAVSEPVTGVQAVVAFVVAIGASIAIGLVVGAIAARIMSLVDDHLIELTISVVVAYGAYLVAETFHFSGVLATVTAAIVLGNVGPGRVLSAAGTDAIDTVWEFLAYLLTAVVFLLVGLAIPPAELIGAIGPIGLGIVAILIGRAIVTYGLLGGASRIRGLPGFGGAIPRPWLDVVFWSGLRGAVAVAMALALPPTSRSAHCSSRSCSGSCCSPYSSKPPPSRGSCRGRRTTRSN